MRGWWKEPMSTSCPILGKPLSSLDSCGARGSWEGREFQKKTSAGGCDLEFCMGLCTLDRSLKVSGSVSTLVSNWDNKTCLPPRFVEMVQRDKYRRLLWLPSSTIQSIVWWSLSIFGKCWGLCELNKSSLASSPMFWFKCVEGRFKKFFLKWSRCYWKMWFPSVGEWAES